MHKPKIKDNDLKFFKKMTIADKNLVRIGLHYSVSIRQLQEPHLALEIFRFFFFYETRKIIYYSSTILKKITF